MKGFIKKLFAAAVSAALLGTSAVPAVSADSTPSISIGGDVSCVPGQTITFPITVSAGNDFESMQLELHYDNDKTRDSSDLTAGAVVSKAEDLITTTKNFNDDTNTKDYGYINIISYTGVGVADGDFMNVSFTVPYENYLPEYTLTLKTVVFATSRGGEIKLPDVTKKITVNSSQPVEHKPNASVSMGGDVQCTPGSLVKVPITVNAGNDFESMQLRFVYGNDLEIANFDTNVEKLSVSTSNDEGSLGIMAMALDNSVKDGDLLCITVKIPEENYKSEYDLTLNIILFATNTNGEVSLTDVTKRLTVVDADKVVLGDADCDGTLSVRDAALIARFLATTPAKRKISLPEWSDYTQDGNLNIRDCAAIAKYLSKRH